MRAIFLPYADPGSRGMSRFIGNANGMGAGGWLPPEDIARAGRAYDFAIDEPPQTGRLGSSGRFSAGRGSGFCDIAEDRAQR